MWGNPEPAAATVNACINGNCQLPGETFVLAGGFISVSVFTVDYGALDVAYPDMLLPRWTSW